VVWGSIRKVRQPLLRAPHAGGDTLSFILPQLPLGTHAFLRARTGFWPERSVALTCEEGSAGLNPFPFPSEDVADYGCGVIAITQIVPGVSGG